MRNKKRTGRRSPSSPRTIRAFLLIAVLVSGVLATIAIHRFSEMRRVIHVTTDLPGDEREGLSWMIERFSRSFPEYSVDVRYTGAEQNDVTARRRVRTDVFVVSSNSIWEELLANGDLVDIPAQIVPESGYSRGFLDAFSRSNSGRDGRGTSAMYAVPIVWAPYGLFVNRNVMQEKGVPVPRSWDDMIDAIHRVAGTPSPIPIAVAGSVAGRVELVGRALSLNGGPAAHGLFDSLLRDGLIHPTSDRLTEEDTALMVRDGRVAMVLGPTTLRRFIDVGSAPGITFVPIPTYDGRPPVVAAKVVAAGFTRRGADKPSAREFLAFSMRPEVQEGYVAASGSRPIYNSVHSSARVPDAEGAVIAMMARIARLIIVE